MSDQTTDHFPAATEGSDPLRCSSAFFSTRRYRSTQDRTLLLHEVTCGPAGSLVEWTAAIAEPSAVEAVTVVRPGAALDGITVARVAQASGPGAAAELYRRFFDVQPPGTSPCSHAERAVRDILRVGLVSRSTGPLMFATVGMGIAAAVLVLPAVLMFGMLFPFLSQDAAPPPWFWPAALTAAIGSVGTGVLAAAGAYLMHGRSWRTAGLIERTTTKDWIRLPVGDARTPSVSSVLIAAQRAQTCLDQAMRDGAAIARPIIAAVASVREAAWELAAEPALSDEQRRQTVADAARLTTAIIDGVDAAVKTAERAREQPAESEASAPLNVQTATATSPSAKLAERLDELAAHRDATAEVAAANQRGRNLCPTTTPTR